MARYQLFVDAKSAGEFDSYSEMRSLAIAQHLGSRVVSYTDSGQISKRSRECREVMFVDGDRDVLFCTTERGVKLVRTVNTREAKARGWSIGKDDEGLSIVAVVPDAELTEIDKDDAKYSEFYDLAFDRATR